MTKIFVSSVWTAFIVCLMDILFYGFYPRGILKTSGLLLEEKAWLLSMDFFMYLGFFLVCFVFLLTKYRLVRIIGRVCFAVFFIFYSISWAMFFLLREFLDIEGLRLMFYNALDMLEHMVQTTIPSLVLLCGIVVLVPVLSILYLRMIVSFAGDLQKKQVWINASVICCTIVSIVLAGTAFSAFEQKTHRWLRNRLSPLATLATDLMAKESNEWVVMSSKNGLFFKWNKLITLENFKKMSPAQVKKIPVILIVVESLRNDVLEDNKVMPNLYNLTEESLYFKNSFAPSNESIYAWPSIMSSQYPLRFYRKFYYPKRVRAPRVLIYDILKGHGYKTAIFSAQNEDWGKMRNFLKSKNLDTYQDSTFAPREKNLNLKDYIMMRWAQAHETASKIDDAVVIDWATQWIKQNAADPFFLALNLQRTHFPYTWPDEFAPPFAPYVMDFHPIYSQYPVSKAGVMKNRYLNALSYVDQQIGRLIQFLKDNDLYDGSLIIVTGDHGEAFYENGVSCHGVGLNNETILTPLIFKMPQHEIVEHREDYVQNLDISPTICRLIGLIPHPAFQGWDLLRSKPDANRPIFISVQTQRAKQDAIILGGWKFIKDYKNDTEKLFNLDKDFQEQVNLIDTLPRVAADLRVQLLTWRRTQLVYYADKNRQMKFYAPKVIRGKGINPP